MYVLSIPPLKLLSYQMNVRMRFTHSGNINNKVTTIIDKLLFTNTDLLNFVYLDIYYITLRVEAYVRQ